MVAQGGMGGVTGMVEMVRLESIEGMLYMAGRAGLVQMGLTETKGAHSSIGAITTSNIVILV